MLLKLFFLNNKKKTLKDLITFLVFLKNANLKEKKAHMSCTDTVTLDEHAGNYNRQMDLHNLVANDKKNKQTKKLQNVTFIFYYVFLMKVTYYLKQTTTHTKSYRRAD